MKTAVILALFGGIYAHEVYQSVLKDIGASQNTVCPLSEKLFEVRVPSVVACAYLCGGAPLGCKGISYDEQSGMCYGCRNTPESSTEVFGTETGVVFYSIFVGYPPNFRKVGKQILKFEYFDRNITIARELCNEYGALAKIDTDEKQTAIVTYLIGLIPITSSGNNFYIQATRGVADNVWRYDNGEAMTEDEIFWAEGEPNERGPSCIVLAQHFDWRWVDVSCTYESFFICEYFEKD